MPKQNIVRLCPTTILQGVRAPHWLHLSRTEHRYSSVQAPLKSTAPAAMSNPERTLCYYSDAVVHKRQNKRSRAWADPEHAQNQPAFQHHAREHLARLFPKMATDNEFGSIYGHKLAKVFPILTFTFSIQETNGYSSKRLTTAFFW